MTMKSWQLLLAFELLLLLTPSAARPKEDAPPAEDKHVEVKEEITDETKKSGKVPELTSEETAEVKPKQENIEELTEKEKENILSEIVQEVIDGKFVHRVVLIKTPDYYKAIREKERLEDAESDAATEKEELTQKQIQIMQKSQQIAKAEKVLAEKELDIVETEQKLKEKEEMLKEREMLLARKELSVRQREHRIELLTTTTLSTVQTPPSGSSRKQHTQTESTNESASISENQMKAVEKEKEGSKEEIETELTVTMTTTIPEAKSSQSLTATEIAEKLTQITTVEPEVTDQVSLATDTGTRSELQKQTQPMTETTTEQGTKVTEMVKSTELQTTVMPDTIEVTEDEEEKIPEANGKQSIEEVTPDDAATKHQQIVRMEVESVNPKTTTAMETEPYKITEMIAEGKTEADLGETQKSETAQASRKTGEPVLESKLNVESNKLEESVKVEVPALKTDEVPTETQAGVPDKTTVQMPEIVKEENMETSTKTSAKESEPMEVGADIVQ